jgi:hypothetical protein
MLLRSAHSIVRRLASRYARCCLLTACLLPLSGPSALGQGPTDVYAGRTIHSLVANYLSNVAPRDGCYIGLLSSALLLQQAVGKPVIQLRAELGLIRHTELEAMVRRVLTAPAQLRQRVRRYVE